MLDIDKTPAIVSTANADVDLLNPTGDMIHLSDITQSLSRKGRYCDQSGVRFTVAQHTLLCLNIATEVLKINADESPDVMLHILLHDAHEAYTGDISRPLKRLLDHTGQVTALEERLDRVIFARFGLDYDEAIGDKPLIKRLDNLALHAECEVCFPEVLDRWQGFPEASDKAEMFTHMLVGGAEECRGLGMCPDKYFGAIYGDLVETYSRRLLRNKAELELEKLDKAVSL